MKYVIAILCLFAACGLAEACNPAVAVAVQTQAVQTVAVQQAVAVQSFAVVQPVMAVTTVQPVFTTFAVAQPVFAVQQVIATPAVNQINVKVVNQRRGLLGLR